MQTAKRKILPSTFMHRACSSKISVIKAFCLHGMPQTNIENSTKRNQAVALVQMEEKQ